MYNRVISNISKFLFWVILMITYLRKLYFDRARAYCRLSVRMCLLPLEIHTDSACKNSRVFYCFKLSVLVVLVIIE